MWAKTRMAAALAYLKRSQKTITEQADRRAWALTVGSRANDADKPAIGLQRLASLYVCGQTVPKPAPGWRSIGDGGDWPEHEAYRG